MDDPNTTTGILDEADEDILTYTVSDEALEAAAGIERVQANTTPAGFSWAPDFPKQCCL
jgi:hypothetical protein